MDAHHKLLHRVESRKKFEISRLHFSSSNCLWSFSSKDFNRSDIIVFT